MANSESNKMMENFFVLYPGMNVLAVIDDFFYSL